MFLKTTEEDEEQEKRQPQAMASATDSRVDAAVAVVLSELHDTTTLKEHSMALKDFSQEIFFALFLSGFGKSLV